MRFILYIFVVFVALSLLISFDKIFFSPSAGISFVYGLKTKNIHHIAYLPEIQTAKMDPNATTIGVYSKKENHFFLKELLQTSGVPYIFTNDLNQLKKCSIIFLDFNIDKPEILSKQEKDFFYQFVSDGGVLIGNEILATHYGALKELFGYRGYRPSRMHKSFRVLKNQYDKYLNREEERYYSLSHISHAPYTNIIELGSAKPLAIYEDNTTAISINAYGKGKAINLGISLFDLRYRNLVDQDFHANKQYINEFEPLSDFMILFLKGIYEATLNKSIFLHTAKDGNQATVIMTHDIDFDNSIRNIPKFTKVEDQLGFKATYNIQVKYITDYKDRAFFLPKNLHYLLDAQEDGHEIGSHTILHTKNFFVLPKGDCNESYPAYKPFSVSDFVDSGDPTACGEIKVSKELLLGAGIDDVVSFRSGELLFHPNLPELLENLGYRYSSCFSAEDVLSYFPYRYIKDYKRLKVPSKIWEIPLVLEDEFFPPMYFRISHALELFEKIYENGAVYTILIHPDLTWYKLKNLDLLFMREFYAKLPKDVWKATMKEVGDFWDRRDRVVFRYHIQEKMLTINISSSSDINGLSFQLNGIKLKQQPGFKIRNNKLVINVKKGISQWQFYLQ
jgi:peptidoglycan/xylan/chitin deacetylase (PgdA/CDA1 family)